MRRYTIEGCLISNAPALRSAQIGPNLGAVDQNGRTRHPNLEGVGDEGAMISFESLALNLTNVFNKRFSPFSSSFVFFYSN